MPSGSRSRADRPLVEVATHVAFPDDITGTLYDALIASQLPDLGVMLDGWQVDLWTLGLGVRDDLTLACDVYGMTASIPRQVGKTFGIGVGLICMCLSRPGMTAVWTSHHDRTTAETLEKMAGLVARPAIAQHMRKQFPVVRSDDGRGIYFANGSRILFGARSTGFGRGMSEIDVQVYDEAQILNETALADMLAAMNVSDIGLAILIGTPPRPVDVEAGRADAFLRRKTAALKSIDDNPSKNEKFEGVYVEVSGDREKIPAKLDSSEFWTYVETCNPSFPHRTNKSAIKRLVANLHPDDVRREVYGIWDEIKTSTTAIDFFAWERLVGEQDDVMPDGVGINADLDGYSVAACWLTDAGAHVEEVFASPFESDTVGYVLAAFGRKVPVKHDSQGAAAAVGKTLKLRGVNASPHVVTEATAANASLAAMVDESRVTHNGSQALADAVRGASRLDRKSGGWFFERKWPGVDLKPLLACTAALSAARSKKQSPYKGQGRTVGNRRGRAV